MFQIREVSAGFKLAGNAPYKAEPIDVWGIGVILFTMLVGSGSPLFVLWIMLMLRRHTLG